MKYMKIAVALFVIVITAALSSCASSVSTEVGGKAVYSERGGMVDNRVELSCDAKCEKRSPDGKCTRFQNNNSQTCKDYLHRDPQ